MVEKRGCKVDAVIDRYDVSATSGSDATIDEELRARWVGENGHDGTGYRSLTEWFNKRLLKRVYDEHNRSTIGTRLDSEYEALTGDDEVLRQEVIADLSGDGIDAAEIRENMVSWSTMRYHLKDCLDATKERQPAESNWEHESLAVIENSTEAKIEKVVRSLTSKGKIEGADEATVHVRFQLACPECPTRVSVEEALERGYVCERHLVTAPSADVSAGHK